MSSSVLASHSHVTAPLHTTEELEGEIREAVEVVAALERELVAEPRGVVAKTWRMAVRIVLGFALFLVVGNLVILGSSAVLGRSAAPTGVEGVNNLRIVDAELWRGAAPTAQGYESLAAAGVTTVIDLRHDDEIHVPHSAARAAGLEVVRLPIRDGQTPTKALVDRFLTAVGDAEGIAFVHCGAGVGRTGALAAAYLESTGQAGGMERLEKNLAVGPPTLEQIVYAATVDNGEFDRPNPAVVAASRLLDAPRRIWHNLV